MSKQVHAQLFLCINRPKIYGKSMEMLLKSVNVYGKLIEMLVKSINVYDEEKKDGITLSYSETTKVCWVQARMTRSTNDKCVFCDFGFRISNVSTWQLVLISEQNESKHNHVKEIYSSWWKWLMLICQCFNCISYTLSRFFSWLF